MVRFQAKFYTVDRGLFLVFMGKHRKVLSHFGESRKESALQGSSFNKMKKVESKILTTSLLSCLVPPEKDISLIRVIQIYPKGPLELKLEEAQYRPIRPA